MRRLQIIFLSLIFLSIGIQAQTNDFEGKIVLKVTTGESVNNMNYMIKGNKVRMDLPQMPMGYMLMRDSTFYVVMPTQKMYMSVSASQQKMMGKGDPLKNLDESRKPVKTGKSKTILGYLCNEYLIKDENGTTTIWATDKFINFPGFDGTGDDQMRSVLGMDKFFPMIVISNENGVPIKMEVTEIKAESVPDTQFELPKDFKEMKLPGN